MQIKKEKIARKRAIFFFSIDDLQIYDLRFIYDLVELTIVRSMINRQSPSIEQSIVPRQSSNRQ